MPKLPSLAGKHLKEQREPVQGPVKRLIPRSIHAGLVVGAVFYLVFRLWGGWDLVLSAVSSSLIGLSAWLSVKEWEKTQR